MPSALPISKIAWTCDLSDHTFTTTRDLEPADEVAGQSRALTALEFGVAMPAKGYNLFVLGQEGAGRRHLVRRYLERVAEEKDPPADWCYIGNFALERTPKALKLPRGMGRQFRDRMAQFVGDLKDALRAAFQSEQYRAQQQIIEEEFKEHQESAVEEVRESAKAQNLTLMRTPMGFTFAPLYAGKVITPDMFEALPQEERDRISQSIKEHESQLQQALRQLPTWAQAAREKMRELNKRTAAFAIDFLIDAVRQQFSSESAILAFLDNLHQDVLKHIELIISAPEGPSSGSQDELVDGHPIFRRYLVNLLVDHAECTKAPVVFEDEPTMDRLFGLIEQRAEMGTLSTDFHLIRSGALHRANGGYLILDVRKVLMRPMAWESLKRAITASEIRIESLARSMGLISTVSLEPEPITLDVKVVLVGDRELYYLLDHLDPEFRRLFKVAVDFEDTIKTGETGTKAYLRLLAGIAEEETLPPFERSAVERVLQQSARLADDRDRFTMQLDQVADLMREAAFLASRDGRETVTRNDVETALLAQIHRVDRIPQRIREVIEEGTIDIDTAGAVVGQINGLSVSRIGALSFGRPARITARISLGKGEVVDIEREVELGGPIHSKGVLILSNLIRARFGQDRPLCLHASIAFEQSYSGVDGDSASLAEACALLSAISGTPLDQRFAVTGSINQLGQVQAIGGVNEKIEGFFDICAARGLEPGQGVLIPATNVRNLVLAERVVDAVRDGKFQIIAIETLEEAVEALMGRAAGVPDGSGAYPPDTVFADVHTALVNLDEKRKAAALPREGNGA